MTTRLEPLHLLLALLLGPSLARAQQIVVQQPVVQSFSVGTTVSVPDRGSAFLGGVSSARSGRSTFGPFWSGSSLGVERESSSASVHVFIHDFEAMDAALLADAPQQPASRIDPRIVRRLEQRSVRRHLSPESERPSTDPNLARDAERLAEQAEARGKLGVAKLHWQRAARHGSTRAARRLADLRLVRREP